MALSLAMVIWHAQAQTAAPNLSGNYRCEPQPMSCRSGLAFSISQSGNLLALKSDIGEQGNGRLTSETTISAGPPWNMLGVVCDGVIECSTARSGASSSEQQAPTRRQMSKSTPS
jgi:hypothetical protein